MTEIQSVILKIYIINFPIRFIYVIKFLMNLKYRNSHRWCSLNTVFLKLRSITGKHLCSSLFLMKLQTSSLATLLKRDSNRSVFL